jgi:hypothetical protein
MSGYLGDLGYSQEEQRLDAALDRLRDERDLWKARADVAEAEIRILRERVRRMQDATARRGALAEHGDQP